MPEARTGNAEDVSSEGARGFFSAAFRLPRSFRKRLRKRRTLRLTREGKYFVGITIGIGLAAINTGNNLLYLLLGWLLSFIVASGLLSDYCLRGIRVTRRLPRKIFANDPFLMGMRLSNTKRRLASYALQVEDICQGKPIDKSCYFLKVPEGKTQEASYRHTFSLRGAYNFTGMRISTRFPFGIFEKSRTLDCADEIVVFPQVHDTALPSPAGAQMGDILSQRVGRWGEFFGLREYRRGDERRSIHWPSSARNQGLMVREFEDESQKRVTLLIDNALPKGHQESDALALEAAIVQCASMACAYLSRSYALRFIARGVQIPFASGELQKNRVLRALALLPNASEDEPFAASVGPRANSVMVIPAGLPNFPRPKVSQTMESRRAI